VIYDVKMFCVDLIVFMMLLKVLVCELDEEFLFECVYDFMKLVFVLNIEVSNVIVVDYCIIKC